MDTQNKEVSSVLSPSGQHFRDQVQAQLFKLRVTHEARRLYQEDTMEMPLPEGVRIDDPLPAESPELLPGILLAHGGTGLVSTKEQGKSLCGLEIQFSLLTGEPLWGAIEPAHTVAKTVHFLAEHTSTTLMGLYKRMQLPHTGRLHVFGPEHLGPMKLLVSSGVRREAAVSFYKRLAEGAGLVVFDPLAAFIQGQAAENDNSPMRTLVDAMIEIAQSTGAACLILGHQGKPQFVQGRPVRRGSYATRGASATEDALTAVHYLEKIHGVSFGGDSVFHLVPIHWKGIKHKPFQLRRDSETCRHTLLASGTHLGKNAGGL